MMGEAALADLLAQGLEAVGPDTAHPALVLDLAALGEHHAATLHALPCPVIGIERADAPAKLRHACDVVLADTAPLDAMLARIHAAPIAAMVLVQCLRASAPMPAEAALLTESLAYATLQQGREFAAWRAQAQLPAPSPCGELLCVRQDECLELTLARPQFHNAINTVMRDALCEALDLALLDPGVTRITLRGAGKCFSVGGDLAEFGLASDPATAHWVRSLRLPARRLLALRPRLEVHVHGAAIGAGVEMAAFAARVTASPHAWFQLPELRYGLIPGAGGTVSLTRRIGRQRTAYLALSGARIHARQALAWGLVDAIQPD